MGEQQRLHQLRLVGLFMAITGCFLVYSLIQERLMTLGFGPQHERFQHSVFIILVNRLVTCAVAAAALSLLGKSLQPAAPLNLFAVPSVANVISSSSQYEALKYVSFPLQALAKCAKTVPVMAWGLLLGGRKYDMVDYVCALTVTFGCALFVLTGSIAAPQHVNASATTAAAAAAAAATHGVAPGGAVAEAAAGGLAATLAAGSSTQQDDDSWMLYGLALLAAFLLFDGLTSTTQDKLFAQYDMHSCNQLLWVSAWSAGISFFFLVGAGQLFPALSFVLRHPSCLVYILLLSAVSTAVQLFIFYTIQQYGALHFALIMTIRQFLSIVLSCLVFRHDLSLTQWVGTILVIGGLVARGTHRGGLDRDHISSKKPPGGLHRSTSGVRPPSANSLLPMMIPIISQTGQDQGAVAASDGAAAAKKEYGSISVDVQAGSLASSQSDGNLGIRGPAAVTNSSTLTLASITTRRKAQDAGPAQEG